MDLLPTESDEFESLATIKLGLTVSDLKRISQADVSGVFVTAIFFSLANSR